MCQEVKLWRRGTFSGGGTGFVSVWGFSSVSVSGRGREVLRGLCMVYVSTGGEEGARCSA